MAKNGTRGKYIAFIADGQLGKRLYGLNETYDDWLNAFKSAGEQILAKKNDVQAVFLLGDTFDAEALYPKEIKTAQDVVNKLIQVGIPVYGILGNHDKGQSDLGEIVSWLDVCNITSLVTAPVTVYTPKEEAVSIVGLHHQAKEKLANTLKQLKPLSTKTYLCLHQSLEELAPHPGTGEVTCAQIPNWISRVFLGDFHNASIFVDKLKRQFIYPGSIETVSFNQDKEPGFIFFDLERELLTHCSTKQREYIKLEWGNIKDEQQVKTLLIGAAEKHMGRLPVVQLIHPSEVASSVEELKESLKPLCLRIITQPIVASNGPKAIIAPQTVLDVVTLASTLLPQNDIGNLGRQLLANPSKSVLRSWQESKFPKVQKKVES